MVRFFICDVPPYGGGDEPHGGDAVYALACASGPLPPRS